MKELGWFTCESQPGVHSSAVLLMATTGWLEQLDRKKIGYRLLDNAFTPSEDWTAAQQLADRLGTVPAASQAG